MTRQKTRVALAAVGLTIGAAPPPQLMTVSCAAELVGVSCRTIRNWHRRDPIGAADPISGVFLVDIARLKTVLRQRFGGWLPYGLQDQAAGIFGASAEYSSSGTIFRRGKFYRHILRPMNDKLIRELTRKERGAYRRLVTARNDLEVLSDAIAVLLDPPVMLAGRRRPLGSELTPLGTRRRDRP